MPRHVWLKRDKETDNKVRWTAEVDRVPFSLYIPKWRVPEPWPERIRVAIDRDRSEELPSLSRAAANSTPSSRSRAIVARVARIEDMTKTIRYAPVVAPEDAELGDPYIPTELTEGGSEQVVLSVEWG